MGEHRWSASLRSVPGLVVAPVIAVPSLAALARGAGLSVFGVVFLLGAIAIGVSSALLSISVGSDGVAIRPVGPRLRWEEIEGFEVAGWFHGTIRVFQRGATRPTLLNAQPVRPRRARELVDRLNAERTAS